LTVGPWRARAPSAHNGQPVHVGFEAWALTRMI
jgi:hypothetical protein